MIMFSIISLSLSIGRVSNTKACIFMSFMVPVENFLGGSYLHSACE